jgi:hypothetical protein
MDLIRSMRAEPLMRVGANFGLNQYSSVSSAVVRVKAKLQIRNGFINLINIFVYSLRRCVVAWGLSFSRHAATSLRIGFIIQRNIFFSFVAPSREATFFVTQRRHDAT